MLARNPIIVATILLISQLAHAEPCRPDCCGASPLQPSHSDGSAFRPPLPFPQIVPTARDITAGRGTAPHARLLRQIAIHASVGNRESVEILTAHLRALGVSAEIVTDAVTWTKLHGSSPDIYGLRHAVAGSRPVVQPAPQIEAHIPEIGEIVPQFLNRCDGTILAKGKNTSAN